MDELMGRIGKHLEKNTDSPSLFKIVINAEEITQEQSSMIGLVMDLLMAIPGNSLERKIIEESYQVELRSKSAFGNAQLSIFEEFLEEFTRCTNLSKRGYHVLNIS